MCNPAEVSKYLRRISRPLLDRIDICTHVPLMSFEELKCSNENESSELIRKRVEHVWEIQKKRYEKEAVNFNSQLQGKLLDKYCYLGETELFYMEQVFEKLHLSARGYHKILRLARTIADMEESVLIRTEHLSEAVLYRSVDQRIWEGRK